MSRSAAARYQPTSVWQIDRHIPVALILAVLLQTGVGVWWASGMDGRVRQLEQSVMASAPIDTRLTRLETRFEAISSDLSEIKGLLRERREVRASPKRRNTDE